MFASPHRPDVGYMTDGNSPEVDVTESSERWRSDTHDWLERSMGSVLIRVAADLQRCVMICGCQIRC